MSVVLAGVTVGINRERYRDATNSYLDYWQGQYNLVINVNNNRPDSSGCGTTGITPPSPASTEGRGTSATCAIVGRVIRSNTDGTAVTSARVYSTADGWKLPLNPGDTDAQVLKDAGLVVDSSVDTYDMSWGTKIIKAAAAGNNPFSVLIVRMPTTGAVHTYVSEKPGQSPSQIVTDGSAPDDFTMCVDPAALVATKPTGVTLRANATNSSGVMFVPEGSC